MAWKKDCRLTNMTYGEKMRSEGWMNCWDNPPKEPGIYEVEDRSGKRYKTKYYKLVLPRGSNYVWVCKTGYDICWWRKVKGERNE